MAQPFLTLEIASVSHILNTGGTTIGRADDNMVVVDDQSVSGHHAVILHTQDGVVLRDLNSTNGTKVNGMPVTESVLTSGDHICFGSVEGRFALEKALPNESTPQECTELLSDASEVPKRKEQGWQPWLPLAFCVIGFGSLLPFLLSGERNLSGSGFVPVLLLAVTGCGFGSLGFLHLLGAMRLQQGVWKQMGWVFVCVAAFTALIYVPLVDGLIPHLLKQKVHGGGRFMLMAWIWQEILGGITAARQHTNEIDPSVRFISHILGVGLLEEITKVVPGVLFAYTATSRNETIRKTAILAAFFGGLGFGAAEALVAYSPWSNVTGWNMNVLRWFRNVPLHGLWAAISASLLWDKMPLIKASKNRWVKTWYVLSCLSVASAIHAANNTWGSPLILVGTAALSIWVFWKYAIPTRCKESLDEDFLAEPKHIAWIGIPSDDERSKFIKAAIVCMSAILFTGVFTSIKTPVPEKLSSPYQPPPTGPMRCLLCGGAGGGYQAPFGWIRCNHCQGTGYTSR